MPSLSHYYIHRQYEVWGGDLLPGDNWTDGTAILFTSEDNEDNEYIDARDCNYLVLYITLDLQSANYMDLRIFFEDHTGTATGLESNSTYAAGVQTESSLLHRYSATGTYRLKIPIMDDRIQIQVRSNGDTALSTLFIEGFVGTA